MGIAERREREKQNCRSGILLAAERVFSSQKGLENATMDDIATEAELSKGALYTYFKNKEDLLAGVHHRGMLLLRDILEKSMAGAESGVEKVAAMARGYVAFSRQYPDHFRIMMSQKIYDMANQSEDVEENVQLCIETGINTLAMVSQIIKDGIADGSVKSGINPEKSALSLWAQMHGVLDVASKNDAHFKHFIGVSMEEFVEFSLANIINTIRANSNN